MQVWARISGTTHQAAIAGKVLDARTGLAIGGVTVSITSQPPEFERTLAAWALRYGASWESHPQRPDRTRTAEDGCFRFIDLPDGSYTLSFALVQGRHRYGSAQNTFTVARDSQGVIQAPLQQILLPPTGVEGQIQGMVQDSATALPLARIRVEDSGEQAYADELGQFYMTGVELGTRTLRISASGFQPATLQAVFTEGQVLHLPTLVLNPAT